MINHSESIPKIDVIINNAGRMAIKDYTLDKQGYEMQLSPNHLDHFLLATLILPKVVAAGPGARIVNVSSDGYRLSHFHFNDWNFSDGKSYNDFVAYGQSKTANILFTVALAERLAAKDVGVGEVFGRLESTAGDTNGSDTFVPEPAEKTVTQGIAPLLAVVLDPGFEDSSGAYIKDCQIVDMLDYAHYSRKATQLWTLGEELVGQKFTY
ncbi:hypothetical protein ACJ41O_006784 [Fusarium nematophilum]